MLQGEDHGQAGQHGGHKLDQGILVEQVHPAAGRQGGQGSAGSGARGQAGRQAGRQGGRKASGWDGGEVSS